MAMLVTLNDMKSYLNVGGSTSDAFLTAQITLISDAIEAYCRRSFTQANWAQTFYCEDFDGPTKELTLYHFPLVSVASVVVDGTTLDSGTYRLNKPTGSLVRVRGNYGFITGDVTVVTYAAGYATIPSPISNAVYELVAGRYNKKIAGIQLDFGSDVQRISISGVMSVDFDYSLNNNERKNAFGSILQGQLNVIDYYRSERVLVGNSKLVYVAVAV